MDNNFLITTDERKSDAKKTIDVKYFMYTDSSPKGETISTPLASNGKHLYSPNESVFKIEITRPYFADFGDISQTIDFDENTFEETLGEKSFSIHDNGMTIDGTPITASKDRVKLRLSADG